MQKLVRALHLLDYVLAASMLVYGAFTRSPVLVALGVCSLVLARLNLAQRISSKLQGYLHRKRGPVSSPLPEVADSPVELPADVPPQDYGTVKLTVGALQVGSSPHGVLRTAEHLNHAQPRA